MLVSKDRTLHLNHLMDFKNFPESLRNHMASLSCFIEEQVNEFEPEIRELIAYSLANTGKRIRPILAFYSGWPESNTAAAQRLVYLGTIIEFIHLATLIHDDLIDEAALRHNRSTVHSRYGASVAVLLGDALLSQSLVLATSHFSLDTCRTLLCTIRKICAGEISQTLQEKTTSFNLEEYYRSIHLKTAELLEVSCKLGAQTCEHHPDYVAAVSRFGHHLGMAYQILDDLIDFVGNEKQVGKTLGTDLAKAKFTLPLLLLFEKLNAPQKKDLLTTLKEADTNTAKQLIPLMNKYQIFEEAGLHFQRQIDAAELALAPFQDYPGIPYLKEFSRLIRGKMSQTLTN